MTPALYVLLTFIEGVAHFSNPTSLHNCEEGRSIAFYGQTIEEKHKADLEAAQAVHAWYNDHPPRMPKNADEWNLVAQAKSQHADSLADSWLGIDQNEEAILVDKYYYMIQDLQPVPSPVQFSPIGFGQSCQVEPSVPGTSETYGTSNSQVACFSNIAVCIPENDVP